MTIYLGADHRGFDFKKKIYDYLKSKNLQVVDEGDKKLDLNDDFPQFASRVVHQLLADKEFDSRGILVCGSGQGMAMAANRFKGIRASLCLSVDQACAVRDEDDSNVLCLASDFTDFETAKNVIDVWLATPFAAASRYIRRLKELDELN
jgi:ribose 5-phosphate isomerase B